MATRKNKEVFRIIDTYLSLLRQNNIHFNSVYLYGSYAKGKENEDSDIDLAIISDTWERDHFDTQFLLMKIGSKIDSRIEPHPFLSNEFDESDPYIKEIIKTGVRII